MRPTAATQTAIFGRSAFLAVFVLLSALLFAPAAWALETKAKQAILIDATTGAVLLEKDADTPMPPSSMSKMMTIYLLFDALKSGSLSLDDTFAVSRRAWRWGGSKMWVLVDTRVRVEDLIRGIIIHSGNDASIVVAEGLAGSEEAFADMMNERARAIGLENSNFRNATGWPAEGQYVTARDLAQLALRTIRDFPEYYRYYAEKNFTYNNIRQGNRNPLLYQNLSADGLKTGHTEAAGYGLTSSAARNGRRLILVVNGLTSERERSRESARLLDWGYREFDNYPLFAAGETVEEAGVWLGRAETVPLVIDRDVVVTLPRRARRNMKVAVVYEGPVPAPIAKGTQIANLRISAPGRETIELPLNAGADVEQLGFAGRLGAAFKQLVWGPAN
ncbi:MAG: D-alanyl-D-alanine carboxypeptidase family protein [Alphaproteobacteria bacterium]